MSLPAPNLDDRRFQDIVDEAKRRIARYCPEWTDHNVSDPGVALIELFAWMTEVLLYRLNQVPDRLYVKFLELVGIELASSAPARTDLLFPRRTTRAADPGAGRHPGGHRARRWRRPGRVPDRRGPDVGQPDARGLPDPQRRPVRGPHRRTRPGRRPSAGVPDGDPERRALP